MLIICFTVFSLGLEDSSLHPNKCVGCPAVETLESREIVCSVAKSTQRRQICSFINSGWVSCYFKGIPYFFFQRKLRFNFLFARTTSTVAAAKVIKNGIHVGNSGITVKEISTCTGLVVWNLM